MAHVGKLYNVLAREIAQHIYERIEGIQDVSIQIVSAIGRPIVQPQLVAIEIVSSRELRTLRRQIHEVVKDEFERLEQITGQLIRGELALF